MVSAMEKLMTIDQAVAYLSVKRHWLANHRNNPDVVCILLLGS
jgi:hypothetical protein